MSGPDKPKVIGEEWSDERVKSFLVAPPEGEGSDYNTLLKAYQAMVAGDFERFVGFFVDAGRDLNAVNETGETILDRVSEHHKSQDYARVLKNAGATKSS
ncbi:MULTISPECIES: PA4642 family protein [unclassified Marinobacter]|uniref:PA4642 family protein n=1 Tax=unclassified Marinobacter TaxID=83889 RepID=UPI0026E358CF|nr:MULTISPECIES: PA4642 family protein [unclassified Marinobacter]MDO6441829.1 PA4642 family protein [Marinobacter sp. 2_MG-2023]MDO6824786.1 PA4642 family protein [Marinobacter sp. 1_MG-2023]